MKKYFSLGLRLALIVAVVVAMLSAVNVFTRDTIATRQYLAGQAARSELFPAGTFTQLENSVIPKEFVSTVTAVYQVEENGTVSGYCFDVTAKGYDTVTMIVGINTELIVTGVKILSQAETPGIGSKAVDPEGAFLPQFKGLSSRNLDSVVMVSGATISSKGIKAGVQSAVDLCTVILEGRGN